MSIRTQITDLHATLPEGVTLVAVSKFHPIEALREAYDAGQRIFGESRPQEMCAKQPLLPADVEWHMIGHLQTNKVKYIAPFADCSIASLWTPRDLWRKFNAKPSAWGGLLIFSLRCTLPRMRARVAGTRAN